MLAWLAAGDDLAHFVASVNKPTGGFFHAPSASPVRPRGAGSCADGAARRRRISWSGACGGFVSTATLKTGRRSDGAMDSPERLPPGGTLRVAALAPAGSAGGDAEPVAAPPRMAARLSQGRAEASCNLCRQRDPRRRGARTLRGCQHSRALPSPSLESTITCCRSERRARPSPGCDTNLEEQGYQGAAMLDRLMNGRKTPTKPLRIPPARSHHPQEQRRSCREPSRSRPRGLNYLSEHFMDVHRR